MNVGIIVGGIIITLLFIIQANLFYKRKSFYAVAWFVKNYNGVKK